MRPVPRRLFPVFPVLLLIACVAAAVAAPAVHAQQESTPPPTPPTPELERRVRELENEVRALKEAREGKAAATPSQTPPSGWQNNGFFLTSPDGNFRLRAGALIQADSHIFPSRSGDTGNTAFYLRRARPILAGTVYRFVDFLFVSDVGLGTSVLQDAFVELRLNPSVAVRAGKFKVPFSLERVQLASDISFIERAASNNLVPIRDVGLQVSGDVARGRLSYALGVFDGAVDNGNADGDNDDDKEIAARLFAHPFRNDANSPLRGLGIGIAATHGRTRDSLSGLTLRTAGRSPLFRYADGVRGDGLRDRLAPQLYFYSGPFGLLSEYNRTQQRVRKGENAGTLTHDGFNVQATYFLTGEAASYRLPNPRRLFDPATGHGGAVELALRYSHLSLDSDAFSGGFADAATNARKADAYTLGVNWYLNRAVKLMLNYEHTDFGGPVTFGSDTRNQEDVVLTRFQIFL